MIMSDDATMTVGIQDDVTPALEDIQRFADETGKYVMQMKRQALKDIRDVARSSRNLLSGLRSLYTAFGVSLDPFMNAVLNIVGGTVEMLTAMALAEASTVIGAASAAAHEILSLSIQIVTLPFILSEIEGAKEFATQATAGLDAARFFSEAFSGG